MALTPTQLAAYVKASQADDEFIEVCLAQAVELVTERCRDSTVPTAIEDLATREVAADLFNRRLTRNGLAGFEGPDLTPVRVTRDPMRAADDILRPYVGAGIA